VEENGIKDPIANPKRKLIDEMESLAAEIGTPFRRSEEHLELVIGGIEVAIETSSQETKEAVVELKEGVEERSQRIEGHLRGIAQALWLVCGLLALIAWNGFNS
jgi:hypothetical protein